MEKYQACVLIGKLNVIAANTQQSVYRKYINQAIELIEESKPMWFAVYAICAEVSGALEMMTCCFNDKEADVLRATIDFLTEKYSEDCEVAVNE